jgi:hypothetical protein
MAAGRQGSVMCAEAVVTAGCRRMRFWRKVCLSGTFCGGALNLTCWQVCQDSRAKSHRSGAIVA